MASPPSLQEATASSTSIWQAELEALFHHAKDRFPDVMWQVGDDEEEVWGHKAIIYARAPPSFQTRYFQFRPNPSFSNFEPSTLSLGLPSLSYSRSPSPAPSTTPGGIVKLKTTINPALFSNELEYLYTGQGFGEAFEFLFETPMVVDGEMPPEEQDPTQLRIDKLRKDLVFMWRSRLYSDVKLALNGTFGSSHEDSTAIFSSHRFVLVSRCSYFHTALIAWPKTPGKDGEPITLTLPSPPFTPASLHFTLGFIYTGTLIFSHRTYDLSTAFHILLSATYLSLQSLYDEIQARIVQEMLHGLFHAFIEFSEYESLTQGRWGTGGCRCRQCARRAPRVLEFALRDDVKNKHLERGARRALVGFYGEGWCTQEFASLPPKLIDSLVKGVGKRSSPINALPLLFASKSGTDKIARVVEPWADTVRNALQKGLEAIEDAFVRDAQHVFDARDWSDTMETDGVKFEDGERVELVLTTLLNAMKSRGNSKYAASIYQALVSSILLRPHATESNQAMLSTTSHIRVQVEQTRMDVLAFLRKRWLSVKQDGGFDELEGWAVKEIADFIEVPLEELLMPTPSKPKQALSSSESIHEKMSAVASRNPSPTKRSVTPSRASVRSVARSVASTATNATKKPERPDSKLTPPGSSVPPSLAPSLRQPPKRPIPPLPLEEEDKMDVDIKDGGTRDVELDIEENTTPSAPLPKTLVKSPPGMFSKNRPSMSPARPNSRTSLSPSVATRKSSASRTQAARGLKPPARTDSRLSNVSTLSQSSVNEFKTATGGTRSRKTSTASVRSNLSTATSASVKTNASGSTAKKKLVSPSAKGRAEAQAAARARAGSAAKRPPSVTSTYSIKSTTSTLSTAASAAQKVQVGVRKASTGTSGPSEFKVPPVPAVPRSKAGPSPTASATSSPKTNVISLKAKARAEALANADHKKTESVASSSSAKTASTLKRKGSTDTIKSKAKAKSIAASSSAGSGSKGKGKVVQDPTSLPATQLGATLDIGIPCIISSKRKRFKAFARYIGEVEGELGPWVGVEVPIPLNDSSNTTFDESDGRAWHDGTWGGIRYFDIAGSSQSGGGDNGSEWDYGGYGDDSGRASSRRRWQNQTINKGIKRPGDTLGLGSGRSKRIRSASPAVSDASMNGGGAETRGLFVRPAQVLYVVDADGDL